MKILLLLLPLFILFSCASAPEKPVTEEPVAAVQPAAPSDAQITADAEKARAEEAMEKARSVKADVAVKDEFSSALGVYNEAGTLASGGADSIPAAREKYLESEKMFLAVYETALAKREEAEKQLEKARQDIKNVEEEAEAFDREQDESETGGES